VSHLDIDAVRGLVWIIDMSGHVWFTTGVTADCPDGSGHWYQVTLLFSWKFLDSYAASD